MPLLHQQDHEKGQQARNDRQIKNGAYANMQRVEQEDGEQGPEERACIVAKALKPEGFASVSLIHGRRDERITRC